MRADSGLELRPDTTLAGCPPLDVLFVPGGYGQWAVQTDETVLAFLRDQGSRARYVTSVCTGALVLGAAGLLEGYDATTTGLTSISWRPSGPAPSPRAWSSIATGSPAAASPPASTSACA